MGSEIGEGWCAEAEVDPLCEGVLFVCGADGQLAMELGLGPVMNPLGLFWCCGDCFGVTQGKVSLTWKPPDQRVGVCHRCGRRYEFGSRYGEEELVAAGGRVVG